MVGLEIVSKPLRKMQDDDGIQQQWKPSHEFDQIAWKQKVQHRELLEQNLGLIARFVEEWLSSWGILQKTNANYNKELEALFH